MIGVFLATFLPTFGFKVVTAYFVNKDYQYTSVF